VKRSIPGHSWRQIRGNKFPRTDWKSDLVQLCIIRFIYQHKPCMVSSVISIYLLILIKTLHRHSYNEIIHNFTVYEHNIRIHMNFKMQ
jgi:hypothetical protein